MVFFRLLRDAGKLLFELDHLEIEANGSDEGLERSKLPGDGVRRTDQLEDCGLFCPTAP